MIIINKLTCVFFIDIGISLKFGDVSHPHIQTGNSRFRFVSGELNLRFNTAGVRGAERRFKKLHVAWTFSVNNLVQVY